MLSERLREMIQVRRPADGRIGWRNLIAAELEEESRWQNAVSEIPMSLCWTSCLPRRRNKSHKGEALDELLSYTAGVPGQLCPPAYRHPTAGGSAFPALSAESGSS